MSQLQDLIADLFSKIPVTCGNCRFKNPPETQSICVNCGEDILWDPPSCDECMKKEDMDDFDFSANCPVCDSLMQDYMSNKEGLEEYE